MNFSRWIFSFVFAVIALAAAAVPASAQDEHPGE